jgi:hypothetical protein
MRPLSSEKALKILTLAIRKQSEARAARYKTSLIKPEEIM